MSELASEYGYWALEILVLAAVIYAFIRFLQETRGSAVMKGFIVLTLMLAVGFASVVNLLGLIHLGYVAQNSLSILVIALVVIFQPELRQALVRLGESRLLQRMTRATRGRRSVVEDLTQASERLARRGLGAIMLIERDVGIAGFTEGGVQMDAKVSAPLLVTVFFKDTPLHDGAVIIRGRRVVAAGCVLPLSENPNLSKTLGTRHRAAIGATEENDAIAVVVSEETQKISVAMRGQLEVGVSEERLVELLTVTEQDGEEAPVEVVA